MGKALRVESVCADAHANEIATPGGTTKKAKVFGGKKRERIPSTSANAFVFYMARFPYRGD
jgi:hypothetical protein